MSLLQLKIVLLTGEFECLNPRLAWVYRKVHFSSVSQQESKLGRPSRRHSDTVGMHWPRTHPLVRIPRRPRWQPLLYSPRPNHGPQQELNAGSGRYEISGSHPRAVHLNHLESFTGSIAWAHFILYSELIVLDGTQARILIVWINKSFPGDSKMEQELQIATLKELMSKISFY